VLRSCRMTRREVVGRFLVVCLTLVAGCSAVESMLPGGPTAQTVTNEIGALETGTRGTRIVADTLQGIHLLAPKTVASIARVLADTDTACNSARTRLQAGDVSSAASTIRTAQAEFADDADIKEALAQAEQLLRDPDVRAALRVVRIDPARSR
jgi:hypothetical protein